MYRLNAPALRSNLRNGYAGGIVDEDIGFAYGIEFIRNPQYLGRSEVARAELLQVYFRFARHDTHDELFLAHFEAEYRNGRFLPYCGIGRDI